MVRVLPLVLASLVLAACDFISTGPQPVAPRPLSPTEAAVVSADNAFTFRLFEQVTGAEPGENVFVSPLSAAVALSMALNGARGETRDEMIEALQKGGLSEAEINAAYRGLLDLVPFLDLDVEMAIANAAWSREGFPIEEDFIDTLRLYYDAEASTLDFDHPAAADAINAWASRQTRGRITEIIDPPIHRDVVMYLLNALYFKAAWRHPFDPDDTLPAAFHRDDGTTSTVDMMNQTGSFAHFYSDRFAALDLPYGDSLYSMTVLLPHEGESADELIADLDEALWAEVVEGLTSRRVNVFLPRLRLEYEALLNDALQALGMERAFDPDESDFSGINPRPDLHISRVLQKTFVEIDEEGTEAAAVTAVGVMIRSGPAIFRVDRPYVFVLRERTTGAILFIGRITDPAA